MTDEELTERFERIEKQLGVQGQFCNALKIILDGIRNTPPTPETRLLRDFNVGLDRLNAYVGRLNTMEKIIRRIEQQQHRWARERKKERQIVDGSPDDRDYRDRFGSFLNEPILRN